MASAIFVNATLERVSINLNSGFENHVLEPMQPSATDERIVFEGWSAPIEAYAAADVFGGGSSIVNFLTVFSGVSLAPAIYEIRSDVSVSLDLYIYVNHSTVFAGSATGSVEGITITAASTELAAKADLHRVTPS